MQITMKAKQPRRRHYARVVAGAVLAVLVPPAQAWQAASQHSAGVSGEFQGQAPAEWEVQVSDVAMKALDVSAFRPAGQGYQATLNTEATDKNLFQVRLKKALRHKAINNFTVEYLGAGGGLLTPEWDGATQLTTLAIPGTLTATGTAQPLTVSAKFRGGVAYEARTFVGGSNKDSVFCRKSGIKTTGSYGNYIFAGLIAPRSESAPLNATAFNAYDAITKASIDATFVDSEAAKNKPIINTCDGTSFPALTSHVDMKVGQFGAAVGANDTILPNGSANYPIANHTTNATLAAVLALAGNTQLTLTSAGQPRPGSWQAPLTVRLTAI